MKPPTAADYVTKKQWPIKTARPASFLDKEEKLVTADSCSTMKCKEVSEAQGNQTSGRAFVFLFGNYQWVHQNRVPSLLKASINYESVG